MHDLTRRQFLATAASIAMASRVGGAQTLPATMPTTSTTNPAAIDRKALVGRHNITLRAVDPLIPLQVGNGEFAFACDVTGLQSLHEAYDPILPLCTLAQWAWHRFPNTENYSLAALRREYEVGGRKVPYFYGDMTGQPGASTYLRANPHRINLARLAFINRDGTPIRAEQLGDIEQTLDLWTGIVRSRFTLAGQVVEVFTVAHPQLNLLAIKAKSTAFAGGGLAIRLAFSGASDQWRSAADWDHPDRHTTTPRPMPGGISFERRQDDSVYHARATWSLPDTTTLTQETPHAFTLRSQGDWIEFALEFSPRPFDSPMPTVAEVLGASAAGWEAFWSGGAAIDFADSTDPRAPELERRTILSQYVTAVNCAASMPPQETGLLFNSWFGKQHLEMHWWHAAHFAMWGRPHLLERSLGYYEAIKPVAKEIAQTQGYQGVRWPKMVGPEGHQTPSEIGVFLIWQQPHPIYYAEQIYRAKRTKETLDRYADIVEQTALFMASYPVLDAANDRYVLGPALIPAQESYGEQRASLLNPTWELAYWVWGLTIAQKWRVRLGLPREPKWDEIVQKLSKPTVRDGRYAAIETEPYLVNGDHPSYLGALGFLPKSHLTDESIMRETAKWTLANWQWDKAWGWDFGLLAQTAARVKLPELAIDALLIDSPKNRHLANGHNFQDARLPAYLPGNGAHLSAIAMMAGGWDGSPEGATAPGFPANGKWKVKTEGFTPVI